MNWLSCRIQRFFFLPDNPLNLGVCRAAVFGAMFVVFFDYSPGNWSKASSAWQPTVLFRLGQLELASATRLAILATAWKCSLLASALGIFTRFGTACAAVLGFYLIGLHHCFGKVDHTDALVTLTLVIFACSRCGDAFSIDSLLKSNRAVEESPEYRWPIRLHWLLFALIWFDAGTAKLRARGFAWAVSDNMANMLVSYYHLGGRSHPLSLVIAQHDYLSRGLAIGSLVLEVSAPVLLFARSARVVIVLGLLSMQLSIWLLMGINFKEFYVAYLLFVPWPLLLRTSLARLRFRGRVMGLPKPVARFAR